MDVFIEISLILVVGTLIAGIMRLLKQPLIMGHILTGLIVGPYVFGIVNSSDTIQVFSQFGIALLLFIVGLNLNPRVIREVGKVALVTGIAQVFFTSVIGICISFLFGFSLFESLYIGIALTFSSTIIILKLLSDKKELGKLFAKISIGMLLVQDIIASLILMVISAFSKGEAITQLAVRTLIVGVIVAGVLFLVSRYALPMISKIFAQSQEFLFLFSMGWGLGIASLVYYLGFSLEIGALIAGVALSVSPYQYEVSAKMRPVRDFFIILFFIFLGSDLVLANIGDLIIPAIVFSFFVLVGNPLIVLIFMGLLGYKKQVSFKVGLTMAQISEFSLILVNLGFRLGHLNKSIVSLVTIVGLVTITSSTYLIMYSDKLYNFFSPFLSFFEKKETKTLRSSAQEKFDIILFGYNRVGYDFVQSFLEIGKKFLVVDYDPEAIAQLEKEGIHHKYGDAQDSEFLEELDFTHVTMVVSTIPAFETNLFLVQKVRRANQKAITIIMSHSILEARDLYEAGATYVVMPHFLGAHYASQMIIKNGFNKKKFDKERSKHLASLDKRQKMGHEHPIVGGA